MDEINIVHNALNEIDRAGAEVDRRSEEFRKKDAVPVVGWLISTFAYRRYRKAYDNYMDLFNINMAIVNNLLGR